MRGLLNSPCAQARAGGEDAAMQDALARSRDDYDREQRLDVLLRESLGVDAPADGVAGATVAVAAAAAAGPAAGSAVVVRAGAGAPSDDTTVRLAEEASRYAELQRQREEADVRAALEASLAVDAGRGAGEGLSEEMQLELLMAEGGEWSGGPAPAAAAVVAGGGGAGGGGLGQELAFLSEEDQLRIMTAGGDPEEELMRIMLERSQADARPDIEVLPDPNLS